MDHKTVQSELQAYLDGTLAPDETRAVRAHLDGCADCRAEWALLREVDEMLRAWPVLPEPEGLTARVMNEIGATTAPRLATAPWRWLRERWSEALLGAVLAATIVILAVSLRAWSTRAPVDLQGWDLQVQRALATVERSWYTFRADAGRGGGRGRPAGAVVQFYYWAAGAIVLLAGAVSVGLLARQWRQVRAALGGWTQAKPASRGLAKAGLK